MAPPVSDRVRMAVGGWAGGGFTRVKLSLPQILLAAGTAAVAYLICLTLWGHQYPFFASITAFIIIGFTLETKVNKVLGFSFGVLLGVLLGETARLTIGSGVWQIFVTITVAVTISRFLNDGIVFSIQAGIQSLLVMVMPVTPVMEPTSRIVDALTGIILGAIASFLFTGDPRRAQSRAANSFFLELEDALNSLALSARTGTQDVARAALRSLRRSSQRHTDAWQLANDAAEEITTYSPTAHRHARHVQKVHHLLVGSDRAMRNVRVIARRQVEFMSASPGREFPTLAAAYVAGVDAVQAIRLSVGEDAEFTEARRKLKEFTAYLTPEDLLRPRGEDPLGRAAHFQGITLVIQLRSLAIDLLEATGLEAAEARRFLPSLIVASDGNAIGPRPLTMELQAVEPPATTEALELLITDRTDPDRNHPRRLT
ncbi:MULTISPECIES: FUSC family protein [Helcobacillus]|uniref:Uncharacterized membrane protein YgaE (UPF0421/DUF939 family) n=1 Tax=Helcobacillus massiliensis TaxID=521392 RepID=A0A839QRX3_9MICO|nr:FUSC family protein [Helcobacillus massiliensis]MBB3023233.1 uncharacterized membrane protein YgaE (UPF0421/DUF939 family) [Helcobacillus massiliensis]MCG7427698.1 FUSC family protein [Helcobacillus sp. ACRRO]MDK7741988.1 FUSC family protein [Helcobacillus massiliensis]WOO93101.1 FUSC family protein [Helcobacillus massiliensis]